MSVMRSISSTSVLLIAAFVAAGCGGDSGSDSKDSGDAGPVEVRAATQPTADEDLTDALGDDAKVLTDAGCAFGTYELEDPEHVDAGDDLDSGTFPPTSGRHFGDWAPFGLYDEPVDDGYAVHNLEHGGVAVWLGTEVDDATADAIAELLDDEEKWLVAPREDLEGLFSAAWGAGLTCPPAALDKLGASSTADALDAWYEVVESTGSEAEKDVPAYAGAMKEPTPERDISTEAPF
jgi:hypothetical protein